MSDSLDGLMVEIKKLHQQKEQAAQDVRDRDAGLNDARKGLEDAQARYQVLEEKLGKAHYLLVSYADSGEDILVLKAKLDTKNAAYAKWAELHDDIKPTANNPLYQLWNTPMVATTQLVGGGLTSHLNNAANNIYTTTKI